MRKFLLLIVCAASFSTVRAQSFFAAANKLKTTDRLQNSSHKTQGIASTQSAPFYSADFSSGIPSGWTNIDNAGGGVVWTVTTTGSYSTGTPVEEQLNPVGTTASNGYIKLDSDSAGPGTTEDAVITTAVINCTGHSVVHLVFNEYFAQFGISTGTVSVSNNNLTWTDVHSAETGLVQDSGTANPNSLDIDISSIAANQSTVYIRFKYIGNFDYWWFVDDVQLYEPSATDLAALSIADLDRTYTQIPFSQATALTLQATVKNMGLSTVNGATALYEVVDAVSTTTVFSEVININSLNPGATTQVAPVSAFAPSYASTYKARVTVNAAGDGYAGNNMMESATLVVTDSVYARDNGIKAGVQGVGAGPGEDGAAGQNFKVNASDYITSITFFLADTFSFDPSGTPIYFTIHPQADDTTNPDGSTVLAMSDTLLAFPGTVPAGGAFFTLTLSGGPLNVTPGLYFIAFHEVDLILPMGYSTAIYNPGAVWVHFNSIPTPPAINGWAHAEDFGFDIAYMIRANFGSTGSAVHSAVNDNGVLVYPNPANDVIHIRFAQPMKGCTLELHDAMGKVIRKSEAPVAGFLNMPVNNLANGAYMLRIVTPSWTEVRKLMIRDR